MIAGSTRMKAGTAQKLVLNMLSTATMVKLGRVFSGLMIHMEMKNEKLRERGRSIVVKATGSRSGKSRARDGGLRVQPSRRSSDDLEKRP